MDTQKSSNLKKRSFAERLVDDEDVDSPMIQKRVKTTKDST